MRGLKLLFLIVGVGWIASYLLTSTERAGSNPYYLAIESMIPAVLTGLIAWLFSDKNQTLSPLAKPVCWTVIVIGLLGFGRNYGHYRDLGSPLGAATLASVVSVAGLLIAAGFAALWMRRRTDRREVIEVQPDG